MRLAAFLIVLAVLCVCFIGIGLWYGSEILLATSVLLPVLAGARILYVRMSRPEAGDTSGPTR